MPIDEERCRRALWLTADLVVRCSATPEEAFYLMISSVPQLYIFALLFWGSLS
jgi:hypothetical protein